MTNEHTGKGAWCPGFSPISLEHKGTMGHNYTIRHDDMGFYTDASWPRPCPACTELRNQYMEDMERITGIIKDRKPIEIAEPKKSRKVAKPDAYMPIIQDQTASAMP